MKLLYVVPSCLCFITSPRLYLYCGQRFDLHENEPCRWNTLSYEWLPSRRLVSFLAGHSVAMVTYCVTKTISMCSPLIGQFVDTMIVASIDKEWL